MIDPAELKSEELLNEIHHQREVARNARSAADRDRSLAINLKKELTTRLERIEEERQQALEKARLEAQKEITLLREEMDTIRKDLAHARQPLEALKAIEERVEQIDEKTSTPVERKTVRSGGGKVIPRLGAKVKIGTLEREGVITAIGENDVEVQVGNLRIRSRISDLRAPNEDFIEIPAKTSGTRVPSAEPTAARPALFRPSPGMEIDLRGQRAEDALDVLETYIDNAYTAGMPFVRIIHGKGTGRLRQVIREALKSSELVKSFEEGGDKEGGEGVTIAHLSPD
jgi:DNA mismatch repair protein MutS2